MCYSKTPIYLWNLDFYNIEMYFFIKLKYPLLRKHQKSRSSYPRMTVDLRRLIYFFKFYPPTTLSGATILLLVSHFKGSIIPLQRGALQILCYLNTRLLLLKTPSKKCSAQIHFSSCKNIRLMECFISE